MNLQFFLSGQSIYNNNPAQSLGSNPTQTSVSVGLNTLFYQAESNTTIYRCIYAINNSSIDFEDVRIEPINQSVNNLATISIGLNLSNEIQLITITGIPSSGNFTIQFIITIGGITVIQTTSPINWSQNPTIMNINVQNALNALTYLGNVNVSSGKGYSFLINFGENRAQNLLQVTNLAVIGATGSNITRITPGSPINSTATWINVDNQPPVGVEFINSETSIGTVRSGDLFAIWLSRTTGNINSNSQTINQTSLVIKHGEQI